LNFYNPKKNIPGRLCELFSTGDTGEHAGALEE